MIAIDRMTLGSPPAGFTLHEPDGWRGRRGTVTADKTASAGRVIEQTSTDRNRLPVSARDP